MNHQASYKSREEKAELLMTIDQLRDEKEDLVNKAINLSQSIKTLKSELNSREDIANNLKREMGRTSLLHMLSSMKVSCA